MSEPLRKIIIIEDNPDLQELYRYAFEDGGYTVKISGNGLLGITEIVDYMPDVVLLDIMMPEMNGYEFLKALKDNTSIRVPVAVISNLTQDEDKQRALASGASLFLEKSDYNGPDLVTKINDLLAGYHKQAAAGSPDLSA